MLSDVIFLRTVCRLQSSAHLVIFSLGALVCGDTSLITIMLAPRSRGCNNTKTDLKEQFLLLVVSGAIQKYYTQY
jgi:hypothetical protein